MVWVRRCVCSATVARRPSRCSNACFAVRALAVLVLAIFGTAVSAQQASSESLSTTRHVVTNGATTLTYEATAGTLAIRDDAGKARANIFFTAYRNTAVKDAATRPVTFFFNGGPGSSSAWLHLGAFGPRRALLEQDGKAAVPPYRLVDNEATLLDVSDLVFVDPISTGYSRAASGQDVQQFHGVQEDVEALAAFIGRYVARFKRQQSPKFLAGESYGGARVALLTQHLQEKTKIQVNGVILISMVLNFQTIRFYEGNDLPYPLFLPTYAAAALHHEKLASEADFATTLAEVEKFAETEYATALMKGGRLPDEERQRIVKRLAHYTGLSEDYVSRSDLRISATRFRHDLLLSQQRICGRYDSRFQVTSAAAAAEGAFFDPSRFFIARPVDALIGPYLQKDLKYETALSYRVSTDKVLPWNYGSAADGYVNAAPALRQAMIKNPRLRVFVACGYYDLATPYCATRYTLDHLRLEPAQAEKITVHHYRAGHMMYIDATARAALKNDVAQYLRASMPTPEK
jgi:carboxypeptidase C (cathepsin A)